jgi:hypothetical protein
VKGKVMGESTSFHPAFRMGRGSLGLGGKWNDVDAKYVVKGFITEKFP